MSTVSTNNSYWFQALVNRNGCVVTRQGVVQAYYPYAALTEVRKLAREDWKLTIMEVVIYDVTKEGEVGKKILKCSDGMRVQYTRESYTYNPPGPKPYELGTYLAKENFPTLKLEATDG